MTRLPPRPRGATVLGVAGFALAYFVVARLGLVLVSEGSRVAVIWPASGLLMAAAALTAPRLWPALAGAAAAGSFAAQSSVRDDAPMDTALALVNAGGPLLAAAVLLWTLRRPPPVGLDSVRGAAGLVAAAIAGTVPAAVAGAAVLAVGAGAPPATAAVQWWCSDGLGVLAVAPVVLSLAGVGGRRAIDRPDVAWVAVTAAAAVVAFAVAPGEVVYFSFSYAVLPVLLWTAIRVGPRGRGMAMLALAGIASLATLNGRGPFARADLGAIERVQALQGFLAVAAVLVLVLGAVMTERRLAEARLAATSDRLEDVLRGATEFAVVGTDADGLVTVFNAGAERMLGYAPEAVVGRLTPAAFHEPGELEGRARELGVAAGFGTLVVLARRGAADTGAWTYVRADGSTLRAAVTVTPQTDRSGALVGFLVIARDVTESERAEAERAALVRVSRDVAAGAGPAAVAAAVAREVAGLYEGAGAVVVRGAAERVGAWGDAPAGGAPAATAPVLVDGRRWGRLDLLTRPGGAPVEGAGAGLVRFASLVGLAVSRSESRAALERRSAELSTILDGLPAIVWVTDPEGRFVLVNSAFDGLVGPRCVGRTVHEVLPPEFADGEDRRRAEAIASGRPVRHEETLTDPSGRERALLVARSPILDRDGRAYAVCSIATDISERREVERVKDEFVSVVSHELRTPLTSVRGALAILDEEGDDLPPAQRDRMLRIAASNSERLAELVDDILDIERIASGRDVLAPAPCDAGELAVEAADAMRAMADRAGMAIDAAPEACPLVTDAGKVQQVLRNYIANAVKFSPEGSRIRVAVVRTDAEVRFVVADEGRGIPAEMIERVFERFQQVDSSDARRVGGTGLGLAICRQIAGQLGGRVWAESREGAGSRFWLAVPAPRPRAAAPRHARAGSAAPA
ncbi:ATP-binding protein [Miltoncostaea marina]|uniref:ATP-binding protein n=1 Tax=Miltoncostaea marina TaxID=2843215 RepID=UPI001C3DB2DC|nr:MASE1 domain-containing protein [Miltoncostaea marina]